MAFDKNKVMQWVRSNSKIGGTAQSSLRSVLFTLPSDTKPENVFACVETKMIAAGERPNKRKVLDEWKRARIAS